MLPPLSQNHTLSTATNASLKRERTRGSAFWSKRRAFGGFSTLQSIEIIRLASLDCLSELRFCINACSACLKSLTITLDPLVAIKAQKTASSATAQDIDELSDTELEEQEMMFGPMSPSAGGPQPSNEADLRQVKCAQEGILASIFGLEDSAAKAKKLEEKLGLPGGQCLLEEEESAVSTKLQDLVKFLEEDEKSHGLEKLSSTSRLEKYRMMRDLANLYISRHAPKPKKTTKSSTKKPASAKKPKKSAKSKLPNIPNMPSLPSMPSMPSHWDDQLKDIMESQNQSEQNLKSSEAALAAIEKSMGMGSASGDLNGMQWSTQGTQLPPLPGGLGQDLSQKLYGSTGSSVDASAPQPWSGEASFIDSLSLPYSGAQSSSQTPYLTPYGSDAYDEALSALYNKAKLQKLHQAQSHVSPGATGASSISSPVFSVSTLPPKSAKKSAPASKKKNGWVSDTSKSSKSSSNTTSSASSAAVSEKGISTSPGKGPLFEAEVDQIMDDGIDVDMDHPDETEDDSNEDRESASESDDTEVLTPRKRLKPLEIAASSSIALGVNGLAKSQPSSPNEMPKATNAEKMHEYVRASHGIQLETFRLHYVPLKASIVGKALDLTVLQHITLLETGPQDAFWALLVKLTSSDAPITFKSIHTDNMSFSFLKYLATFKSLEELFVHERKSRNHDTDPETGVDMASISKQALKPHCRSLKRLMLRNERDESWDVDTKTLLSLGAQAPFLEELAINVKTATYHALLQMFPLLRSVRALHLITLRGSDRNNYSMPMESIAYAIDSLTHCPEANLRYIAIGEFVTEMTGRQQYRSHMEKILERQASLREGKQDDKKGKGKAVDPIQMDIDETSDGDIREKYSRVHSASRKMRATRRFEEIDSVKIFSKEIRNGKI